MTREEAVRLRGVLETAAQKLEDKEASEAPTFFPRLRGDGALVKAGTKICWNGQVKRAASDLWDTAENNPDNASTLWEDISYREGYRIIPATITAGLAFAKGEKGWWNGVLYESLLANNVYTPAAYPAGWKSESAGGGDSGGEDDEYPAFVQPTGAHDAYNVGDKVTFEGKRYVCKMANCAYSPSAYPAGWEEVT